jgi:hypothetical protein
MHKTGLETFNIDSDMRLAGNSMSFITITYITIPIINEPESPMNIFAGCQLKNKKPSKEPANPVARSAKGKSPVM